MKIEQNKGTLEFYEFLRTQTVKEVELSEIYRKLDNKIITKEDEKNILRECKKINPRVKSFKRATNVLLKNPYYQNIKLDNINVGNISFKTKVMPARTMFVANFPVWNNYGDFDTTMGYYDRNVNIPMLVEDKTLWMSITEMEINTSQVAIDKAHGDVLTFGLGLGYFPYMCSLKDSVNSITIVELNPKVIEIFKEYILPQFPNRDKIQIIQGDMYDFINDEYLSKFNYKFADIWKGDKDGTYHYMRILRAGCNLENFDFWIEDSLIRPVVKCLGMYLILAIFDKTERGIENTEDAEMSRFMVMIDKYFASINKTITTKEELATMITDRELIRNILRMG